MRLRNRIVSTVHAPFFGKNHMYTEQEIYYQAKKAKGGMAMCCLGGSGVDPEMT